MLAPDAGLSRFGSLSVSSASFAGHGALGHWRQCWAPATRPVARPAHARCPHGAALEVHDSVRHAHANTHATVTNDKL